MEQRQIATVALNRPDESNAIDMAMFQGVNDMIRNSKRTRKFARW